jgi:hypothetical protein
MNERSSLRGNNVYRLTVSRRGAAVNGFRETPFNLRGRCERGMYPPGIFNELWQTRTREILQRKPFIFIRCQDSPTYLL